MQLAKNLPPPTALPSSLPSTPALLRQACDHYAGKDAFPRDWHPVREEFKHAATALFGGGPVAEFQARRLDFAHALRRNHPQASTRNLMRGVDFSDHYFLLKPLEQNALKVFQDPQRPDHTWLERGLRNFLVDLRRTTKTAAVEGLSYGTLMSLVNQYALTVSGLSPEKKYIPEETRIVEGSIYNFPISLFFPTFEKIDRHSYISQFNDAWFQGKHTLALLPAYEALIYDEHDEPSIGQSVTNHDARHSQIGVILIQGLAKSLQDGEFDSASLNRSTSLVGIPLQAYYRKMLDFLFPHSIRQLPEAWRTLAVITRLIQLRLDFKEQLRWESDACVTELAELLAFFTIHERSFLRPNFFSYYFDWQVFALRMPDLGFGSLGDYENRLSFFNENLPRVDHLLRRMNRASDLGLLLFRSPTEFTAPVFRKALDILGRACGLPLSDEIRRRITV